MTNGSKRVAAVNGQSYPFWLGGECPLCIPVLQAIVWLMHVGLAASVAASITQSVNEHPSPTAVPDNDMNSPLDLTKVRLQASGDHGMLQSMRKTVATAGEWRRVSTSSPSHGSRVGVRGLWDGISGTLLRQMTYSLTRFSVYEEAKRRIAPGERNPNGLKLAICGSIGAC
jgi:Mitochondrial carrier protein